MSTREDGDAAVVRQVVDDAKGLLAARSEEERQLDLLDPVTPEDMLEAREALGPQAGRLSVLTEARKRKRGRPPGARNRRTDDFARYILGFGQHPAITLMQLASTPEEVLVETSKQVKVHSFRKDGTPNKVIERMTIGEARSLKVRCAEALLPYLESKKPVAVDMTFSGVADLIISGVTHSEDEVAGMLEGDYLDVDDELADPDAAEDADFSEPSA